ncbi:MAG: Spy/CpxP family protein refolding chaperone [Hyphomonadaceae bacterium]|jgi:hypothetical protein
MRRVGIAATVAAGVAFVALGAAFAQTGGAYERGWSQMMMGPMAGCPMGAGGQGMMGPHMMGPGMMQDGMMGSGMMGNGHMMGNWNSSNAGVDPQLDALRSALALTPAQQDEWNAYAAAARQDAQAMADMHGRMIGFMQGARTTAPDWLGAHRDMMRARADSLDTLARAVDRLYDQLDAAQKATFDRYGGGMCGAW